MMSESLIIKVKETSLPDFRLEKIDTKNPGWVRTQRTHTMTKLILVDPVDDEEIRVLRLPIPN